MDNTIVDDLNEILQNIAKKNKRFGIVFIVINEKNSWKFGGQTQSVNLTHQTNKAKKGQLKLVKALSLKDLRHKYPC